MAKIIYLLKQNKVKDSKINGKWFAHGKTIEVMNTRKMANHISEHGSIYTPDVVFGVLEKFRSCLLEMLLNSRRVKIDGLGTFFTTIENEPGGAAKKEDFSPQKNLKALHIRFMPDQEAETNISSREFIKKAEFVNAEAFAGMLTDDEPSNGSGSGSGSSQSGNGGGNTGGNSGGGNSGGGNSGGGGDDDDVTYD
jgi:predicted histone-like DNA-binding protein